MVASTPNTEKKISTSPLSLQKVSNDFYIYKPTGISPSSKDSHNDVSTEEDPKVILLLGWTAAKDSQLFRLVQKYNTIFPTSIIFLVKSSVLALTHSAIARRNIQPAAVALRDFFTSSGPQKPTEDKHQVKPELLIHVMSNGGSAMLSMIYDAYSQQGDQFPSHVTIFDSAPASKWRYDKIITALAPGVPGGLARIIAMPIFHLLATWRIGRIRLFGEPDELTLWANSHNNVHMRAVTELRRLYCYGDQDNVVPVEDVEDHAREAASNGFSVRKELFRGSSHVGHVKTDTARYWGEVEKVWKGEKARL
jgi:hypothetical protein